MISSFNYFKRYRRVRAFGWNVNNRVKVVSELVERTFMDNRSSPFSCHDGWITKRLPRVSTNELIYSAMVSMFVWFLLRAKSFGFRLYKQSLLNPILEIVRQLINQATVTCIVNYCCRINFGWYDRSREKVIENCINTHEHTQER